MSKEDIISRIQKLQAKASNSATTEAEAQAFAEKVQELLAQHNLDLSSITEDVVDEKPNLVEEELYGKPYAHPWKHYVARGAAKLYFCQVYDRIDPPPPGKWNSTKTLCFVGKSHNRKVTIYMYEYLIRTIEFLAKAHSPHRDEQFAFARACGLTVSNRLIEKKEELSRFDPVTDSSVPVLYKSEENQVSDFMNRYTVINKKNKFNMNDDSARAGIKAGQTINLTPPSETLPNSKVSNLLGR